jgi:hypothetical protein
MAIIGEFSQHASMTHHLMYYNSLREIIMKTLEKIYFSKLVPQLYRNNDVVHENLYFCP